MWLAYLKGRSDGHAEREPWYCAHGSTAVMATTRLGTACWVGIDWVLSWHYYLGPGLEPCDAATRRRPSVHRRDCDWFRCAGRLIYLLEGVAHTCINECCGSKH